VSFYALCQLNFFPETYMHASWIPHVDNADLMGRLLKSERSREYAQRYLRTVLGIEDSVITAIDISGVQCTALIDFEYLREFTYRCGLATLFPSLRKMIDKRARDALRDRLGADRYDYTMDVGMRANYHGRFKQSEDMPVIDHEMIIAYSVKILAAALYYQEAGLVKRIFLKMPYEYQGEQRAQTEFKESALCAHLGAIILADMRKQSGRMLAPASLWML